MYNVQTHPYGDYSCGTDGFNHQIAIGLLHPYIVAVFFETGGGFTELRMRPLRVHTPVVERSGLPLVEDPDFQDKAADEILAWQTELRFSEGPIAVDAFCVREVCVGIEDLPRHFRDFGLRASEFSDEERREYPRLIEEWSSVGKFVFWWGHDYYLTRAGEIT